MIRLIACTLLLCSCVTVDQEAVERSRRYSIRREAHRQHNECVKTKKYADPDLCAEEMFDFCRANEMNRLCGFDYDMY